MVGQAGGNRVAARGQPDPLTFARLAPGQVAGRAHQPLEGFGEMRRMQKNRPHARPDRVADHLGHGIRHIAMRGMAPPQQDIGLRQPFRRDAMVRLLQRCGFGADRRVCVQRIGNRLMHAARVDLRHGLVLAFVKVLAPDQSPDRHAASPPVAGGQDSKWDARRQGERQCDAGAGTPGHIATRRERRNVRRIPTRQDPRHAHQEPPCRTAARDHRLAA